MKKGGTYSQNNRWRKGAYENRESKERITVEKHRLSSVSSFFPSSLPLGLPFPSPSPLTPLSQPPLPSLALFRLSFFPTIPASPLVPPLSFSYPFLPLFLPLSVIRSWWLSSDANSVIVFFFSFIDNTLISNVRRGSYGNGRPSGVASEEGEGQRG